MGGYSGGGYSGGGGGGWGQALLVQPEPYDMRYRTTPGAPGAGMPSAGQPPVKTGLPGQDQSVPRRILNFVTENPELVTDIAGLGAQLYGARQQGRMADRQQRIAEEDRKRRIEEEERRRMMLEMASRDTQL